MDLRLLEWTQESCLKSRRVQGGAEGDGTEAKVQWGSRVLSKEKSIGWGIGLSRVNWSKNSLGDTWVVLGVYILGGKKL